MKRKPFTAKSLFTACLLAVLLLFSLAPQAAGTFRFLTMEIPGGTTSKEYFAVILTANAAGTVHFSATGLPPGLTIAPNNGSISGTPTSGGNYNVVITANDGSQTINLPNTGTITVHISASGGCGGGALGIIESTLATGTVGTPYSTTLHYTDANPTPPYLWGAQNLPVGLSLNGLTGEISGTPISAGTFYATFTLTNGTPAQIVTTIPITVYPVDSLFHFTTYLLDNGEVGTAYTDTWQAINGPVCPDVPVQVTYAASGLPNGLSVNATTGVVSGTPQEDGTFNVILTAQDCKGTTITSNLWIWIAPSSTSTFYWKYFGIPAAIYSLHYSEPNFPVFVETQEPAGHTVSYSAIGLPSGITYDPSTGELSGTSYEPGIYPVVFTATDTTANPDVALTLETEFIVLPLNGGDTNSLSVNLWVKNLLVIPGLPNASNDRWSATFIYNANRTNGNLFNPASDTFYAALGSSELEIPPGNFEKLTSGTLGVLSYARPDNPAAPEAQKFKVRIAPAQQTISVDVQNTHLGTSLPADLFPNVVILGGKSYKLKEFINADGRFRAPFDYRTAAFVATSANVKNNATGVKNYARLQFLLSDPVYDYTPGDPVTLRVLDAGDPWLTKEIGDMLISSFSIDRLTGLPTFTLSKTWRPDSSASNQLSKFSFNSATGKLTLELKAPSLSMLTVSEKHLGIELTLGSKTYFTSLTLFKNASNVYSSAK